MTIKQLYFAGIKLVVISKCLFGWAVAYHILLETTTKKHFNTKASMLSFLKSQHIYIE